MVAAVHGQPTNLPSVPLTALILAAEPQKPQTNVSTIDMFELSADDGITVIDVTEATLPMGSARFRSLVMGPDGSLYAAVDEGAIYKMTPGN